MGRRALTPADRPRVAPAALLLWTSVPVSVVLVVVAPRPDPASVPYLVASIALHVAYTLGLVRANQVAQFSQLYPISRGLAPVLVAVVVLSGWSGVDEDLSARQRLAVAVVLVGLLLLASTRVRARAWQAGPVLTAVAIAVAICAYTVVDGAGGASGGFGAGLLRLALARCEPVHGSPAQLPR